MNSPVFALVDCNNFYASCEKLFRPDLRHTPVVVLSNNDGCVVSRSREAKALGIKMAVPFHTLQGLVRQHGVVAFSSNYALYADISQRVMSTLEQLAPRVEVYSIDEAFLDLSGIVRGVPQPAGAAPVTSLQAFGQQLQATIYQWDGMSVGVGIAPTKTLAKLANYAAKHYPATGGVVDLTDPERQRRLLAITPVEEVWGIGHQLAKQLTRFRIDNALALATADRYWLRKQFNVVVERIARELQGRSCLVLDEVATPKQQIMCSRSFGARITDLQAMGEAIASYAARAAEKLREQRQYAKSLTVFIRTNPFSAQDPYYSNAATCQFPVPTDDTRALLDQARALLAQIWRDGYRYMKGGVLLADFYDPGVYQPDLFHPPGLRPDLQRNSKALMQVLDRINHSGKGRVWFAGEGTDRLWSMKREHLSPAYTTRWEDLPVVR